MYLPSQFNMNDLREVNTISGIEVKRHEEGFSLNQSHYIKKLLNKFKLLKIKDANTPIDFSVKYIENFGVIMTT